MSHGCLNATSAPTDTVLGPDVTGHFVVGGGGVLFAFHLNEITENQAKWIEAIGHSLSGKIDPSSSLSGAGCTFFKILF